jgi:hypothetical protein
MNHTYLFPFMDEASYMLKMIVDVQQQIPTCYHKISPNLPLVDELVNLVPSTVNLVDQVVNLISSSVDSVDKVVDLIPSSVDPTLPSNSKTQVVDSVS